jgi:hypothetical protein
MGMSGKVQTAVGLSSGKEPSVPLHRRLHVPHKLSWAHLLFWSAFYPLVQFSTKFRCNWPVQIQFPVTHGIKFFKIRIRVSGWGLAWRDAEQSQVQIRQDGFVMQRNCLKEDTASCPCNNEGLYRLWSDSDRLWHVTERPGHGWGG